MRSSIFIFAYCWSISLHWGLYCTGIYMRFWSNTLHNYHGISTRRQLQTTDSASSSRLQIPGCDMCYQYANLYPYLLTRLFVALGSTTCPRQTSCRDPLQLSISGREPWARVVPFRNERTGARVLVCRYWVGGEWLLCVHPKAEGQTLVIVCAISEMEVRPAEIGRAHV